MRAGTQSVSVRILQPSKAVDDNGQPVDQFVLWRECWANVISERGGEFELSREIQANPIRSLRFDYCTSQPPNVAAYTLPAACL